MAVAPPQFEPAPKVVSKKPKGKKQAVNETPSKVGKLVQKVMKASSASRSHSPGKKSTGKASAGKPKKSPAGKAIRGASPGKASSTKKTTDNMSMQDFKKYLAWHESKKNQSSAAQPQATGKRSSSAAPPGGNVSKRSKK